MVIISEVSVIMISHQPSDCKEEQNVHPLLLPLLSFQLQNAFFFFFGLVKSLHQQEFLINLIRQLSLC